MEVEIDRSRNADEYWTNFEITLKKVGFLPRSSVTEKDIETNEVHRLDIPLANGPRGRVVQCVERRGSLG